MAAIVRMKRKRNDDQIEEIVIHLKRVKDEVSGVTESEESIAKKFKFAATVDSKKTSISDPVSKAIRESKMNKLRSIINNNQKKKNEDLALRTSKLIDFKLVDKKKASNFDGLGENNFSDAESRYLFFDVEKNSIKDCEESIDIKGLEKKEKDERNKVKKLQDGLKDEEDDDYVYDLYYMNEQNFDYSSFNHIHNIQALQQTNHLWVGDDDEVDGYDDDDENQEDYYTNQYPDEDDELILKDDDDDTSDDDDTCGDDDDDDKKYEAKEDMEDFIDGFGNQFQL